MSEGDPANGAAKSAKEDSSKLQAGKQNNRQTSNAAKVSEEIKHHVNEEEKRDGIFAKAKSAGLNLDAPGQKPAARTAELVQRDRANELERPRPRSFTAEKGTTPCLKATLATVTTAAASPAMMTIAAIPSRVGRAEAPAMKTMMTIAPIRPAPAEVPAMKTTTIAGAAMAAAAAGLATAKAIAKPRVNAAVGETMATIAGPPARAGARALNAMTAVAS